MLHIVNRSPLNSTTFESIDRLTLQGSAILLIEDGVYAATRGAASEPRMRGLMQRCKVYVLSPDLEARGVADRLLEGVTRVDYGGFVDLVAEYPSCQSWL